MQGKQLEKRRWTTKSLILQHWVMFLDIESEKKTVSIHPLIAIDFSGARWGLTQRHGNPKFSFFTLKMISHQLYCYNYIEI